MRESFGLLAGVLAVVSGGCGGDAGGPVASAPPPTVVATLPPVQYPDGLRVILGHPHAPVDDTFQVFVCDVPVPTSDPLYGDLTLRTALDPVVVAEQLDDHVRPYFEQLSHGAYHPHFVAGQQLKMATEETHDECVDRAAGSSAADAAAVLVVATAENLSSEPGGWGRPGLPCERTFCPASVSKRAVYVGASDFHPDNGPVPLLDLIEHEIGHTLDLPHSGDGQPDDHASDLDVMSDSAAPRAVQPGRKDAQDTLAINRLALGWLPAEQMAVVAPAGGTFDLLPSNLPAAAGAGDVGDDGLRLLILPEASGAFLTVELLGRAGLDDFLPSGGIAVHSIDQSAAACASRTTSGLPCTGYQRAQITLGSVAPHLELLHDPGAAWTAGSWTVTVVSDGGTASDGIPGPMRVDVHPTEG